MLNDPVTTGHYHFGELINGVAESEDGDILDFAVGLEAQRREVELHGYEQDIFRSFHLDLLYARCIVGQDIDWRHSRGRRCSEEGNGTYN